MKPLCRRKVKQIHVLHVANTLASASWTGSLPGWGACSRPAAKPPPREGPAADRKRTNVDKSGGDTKNEGGSGDSGPEGRRPPPAPRVTWPGAGPGRRRAEACTWLRPSLGRSATAPVADSRTQHLRGTQAGVRGRNGAPSGPVRDTGMGGPGLQDRGHLPNPARAAAMGRARERRTCWAPRGPRRGGAAAEASRGRAGPRRVGMGPAIRETSSLSRAKEDLGAGGRLVRGRETVLACSGLRARADRGKAQLGGSETR